MKFKLGAIAAAAALTAMAGQANAATVAFNFTGGNNSETASRTFTNGGISVTASAWSYVDGNGFDIDARDLGWYSPGLGVNGQNDDHYVDNQGEIDFIYLSFTQAVNLSSATFDVYDVNQWSGQDGDAVAYYRTVGTGAPNGNLDFDDMLTAGAWQTIGLNGNSDGPRPVAGAGIYSTGWIIAAARNPTNDQNDAFKLAGISVNTPGGGAVPEPATWAMMIGGFGAAGTMLRRRKAVLA